MGMSCIVVKLLNGLMRPSTNNNCKELIVKLQKLENKVSGTGRIARAQEYTIRGFKILKEDSIILFSCLRYFDALSSFSIYFNILFMK